MVTRPRGQKSNFRCLLELRELEADTRRKEAMDFQTVGGCCGTVGGRVAARTLHVPHIYRNFEKNGISTFDEIILSNLIFQLGSVE